MPTRPPDARPAHPWLQLLAAACALAAAPGVAATASAQATTATRQVGMDAMGGFSSVRLSSARLLHRAVADRFAANRYEIRLSAADVERLRAQAEAGGSSTSLDHERSAFGDATFDFEPGLEHAGAGAWAKGIATFADLDGGRHANDIDSESAGFVLGGDYRFPLTPTALAGSFRVGAGAGYSRDWIDAGPSNVRGWGDTLHALVHGSFTLPRLYVGAIGRLGYSKLHTRREYLNALGIGVAAGTPTGRDVSAYFEAGGLIGDPETIALRPVFAFDYTRVSQNRFTEGDTPTPLVIDGSTVDSSQLALGVRIARVFAFDPALIAGAPRGEFGFEPELRLFWNHELGELHRFVLGTHATTGLSWVPGAETGRNAFVAGVGYKMRFHRLALLGMDYDARLESQRVEHALRLNLVLHW